MTNQKPVMDTPLAEKLASGEIQIEFDDFPAALMLVQDRTVVGTFERVEESPVEYDFGQGPVRPYIAIMSSCIGEYISDKDTGEISTLDPNEEYALWLIHGMLLNAFLENEPNQGERVAIRYNGSTLKREAIKAQKVDPKYKVRDTDSYHSYSVVLPDRPIVKPQTVSWGDIRAKQSPKQ